MKEMYSKIHNKLRFSDFPFGVYLLLVVAIASFFIATKGTISPSHLLNIMRQAAPLGIAAMGQTIVLLVAGIDLSVGATMSMVNLVASSVMMGANSNIFSAVIISLALCAVIGFANGFIIARFKMQPFLITMAMSMIIEGGYFIYTRGIAKGSSAPRFRFISEGWLGKLPMAALIWIFLWFALSFILRRSVYGHKLYITGGNRQVAKLSGFHSERIIISAYVLCSVLSGIAGLLLSAYIGTASIGVGYPYTLDSIAATVIGGTSFSGGSGNLEGTFPGVLIMMILQSILTIVGISDSGKFITQGIVIAVMVAINQMRAKRN